MDSNIVNFLQKVNFYFRKKRKRNGNESASDKFTGEIKIAESAISYEILWSIYKGSIEGISVTIWDSKYSDHSDRANILYIDSDRGLTTSPSNIDLFDIIAKDFYLKTELVKPDNILLKLKRTGFSVSDPIIKETKRSSSSQTISTPKSDDDFLDSAMIGMILLS